MLCYINIQKTDASYSVTLHQGTPALGRTVQNVQLSPVARVPIAGQSYSLGDLVQALIEFHDDDLNRAFHHRGQLDIGHYLYAQVFGDVPPEQLGHAENEPIDLRIVTTDEHIARLPWVLLAHDGVFLSAMGWSVSLARRAERKTVELPPEPKMLIVAPEPVGLPPTNAREHLENLEERLSLFDPRLSIGSDIQVATTWEDFHRLLKEFEPHLVYYYGHGRGDAYNSHLVFATGAKLQPLDRPMADVAQAVRELPERPLIVYINCCSGDAGGFTGAGRQFGDIVPAVLTNRTVAYARAARAQALVFWKSILLDGLSPHRAVSSMRGKLIDLDLSFQDARWMTPVLYCHYSSWSATKPRRVDPLEHDPHWRLKLDRVAQFGSVSLQTLDMLRDRRPRSLAFVWYGQEGQGVELFHQRLRVQLRGHVSGNTLFGEIRPEWPMDLFDPQRAFELYKPERSFSDMLSNAFDVKRLTDIPAAIRAHTRGETGRQILVYIRHQPVRSTKIFNPKSLKAYLKWWDEVFAPLLTQHVYALLTVSFIVKNPAKFCRILQEQERIYDMRLSRTVFRLLDEMERIAIKDLRDFLQSHNIRLPGERRELILQRIMEETGGHYEMTIEKLRDLVERNWDKTDVTPRRDEEDNGDYDY
ncbi:hypothetical protein JXA70_03450 [candidate division KSB1 bacterium]|nr:hypothetical protein [candidate division KSB1 bacterium]